MEMIINFPGGLKVDAHFGPYSVETDQPDKTGNPASAPTPFATFLASIGTCAGIYVLGFCKQRGLPTEGIQIRQRIHTNPFTGTGCSSRRSIKISMVAESAARSLEAKRH